MRVLHVTDASSAGVLTAVTGLARQQSLHAGFAEVAFGYVRRADSPPAEQIRDMAGDGVRVLEWSASAGPGRLFHLCRGLSGELRRGRYDVLHLHSSRAGFLGRLISFAGGTAARTVYSPHFFAFAQIGIHPLKRSAYLALERLAARWGRRLLLVSDSEYALARALLPRASAAVLPNAVDNSALAAHARDRAAAGVPVPGPVGRSVVPVAQSVVPVGRSVVHVGRIAEQKAPQMFRQAVAALGDRAGRDGGVGPVRATWLGDGDRRLLGDGAGLIEVSGWLPPDELRARLAAADLVLFTSRGEAMPIALLEAQGLGVPVVASRVDGVVDVVEHGVTGYLADTPEELAGYALRLLGDEALRGRLAAAARRRSLEAFDIGAQAGRSLRAYRLLGAVPAAVPSAPAAEPIRPEGRAA